MITDAMTDNKRVVLHQIYVSLYVEFVVKNPLREIDGPVGVETFHLALDQFVRTLVYVSSFKKLTIGISIDTYIAI
jgi:trafficking protein particle complex subunit 1